MELKVKQERNCGIDLLKITAMLMVVILHILGGGGVLHACENRSANHYISWLLEIICICAVNCFALATGFVMVNSKFKPSRIVALWIPVLFYSLTELIVLYFIYRFPIKEYLISMFFPVSYEVYWYFSAYFVLFFFMPILNHALNSMDGKNFLKLLLPILFLFSVLAKILPNVGDTFRLGGGYSVIWLISMYLLGGCLNKNDLKIKHNYFYLIMFFASSALTMVFIKLSSSVSFVSEWWKIDFLSYNLPTTVIAAVCLFQFFRHIKLHDFTKKTVTFLIPMSFFVYIIHTHPMFMDNVIKDRFAYYAEFGTVKMLLAVVGTAILIFAGCIIIEFIRSRVFRLLGFEKLLRRIDTRFLNKVE